MPDTMFTIPTLKSSVFSLLLWSALFAMSAAGSASVPLMYGQSGLLFGLFCGISASLARKSLSRDLTNSSSDYLRRRSAFLNTWFGKLALACELGAMFAWPTVIFLESFQAGSMLFLSFAMARHAGVLCVFLSRYYLAPKRLA
jgi:hypothetical protein